MAPLIGGRGRVERKVMAHAFDVGHVGRVHEHRLLCSVSITLLSHTHGPLTLGEELYRKCINILSHTHTHTPLDTEHSLFTGANSAHQ